jgi:hypothetical protein
MVSAFGSVRVDDAIEDALSVVRPGAIAAAAAAVKDAKQRGDQVREALKRDHHANKIYQV